MRSIAFTVAAAVTLALAGAASAADVPQVYVEPPVAVEARDIVIDLGVGAQVEPQFPSARKYLIQPYPIVGLRFLRLPIFGEVVTGQTKSFSIFPSFNFIGEREASDAAYLAGTDDVDFSAELGLGAAVRYGWVRAFAAVRYGVLGHNAFVADGGIDLVANPTERLEVSIGPRASLASDEYMDTYFGVPAGAFLPQYDPSGGISDVGVAATASFAITENFRIVGRASYKRFVGDAADSPIVDAGNEDEVRVGLGFTYRFGLDLY